MVAIQEKIQTFQEETREDRNIIIRGSDEHLDIINEFKSHLDKFTKKIEIFNEGLIPVINNTDIEDLKKCMPDLKGIYKDMRLIIGKLHNCGLYHDIKSSSRGLSNCTENLREIIHDLELFTLNQDRELSALLDDLN